MAEISTTLAATASQVRSLRIAQRKNGLDDATWYGILRDRWGVDRTRDLTRSQASELLDELGRTLPRPPGTGRPKAPRPKRVEGGATRLVTAAQRALIDELRGEIEWGQGGYEGWLSANQGLTRVATNVQAGKVLQALLAMRRRRDG